MPPSRSLLLLNIKMKEEIKINAVGAFEAIKKAKRILLHLHVKPDQDSIGSALAMHHILKSIGKDVVVIKGDSDLPKRFSFLPGYENIVHKNYFEINLNEFDLFIIQDSGSKELISQKGDISFPSHLKTLIIDHHSSNIGFGDINIIDPSYSAVSELLYDIFTEWDIKITEDTAACLYVGIYGDTGGFKYASTSVRTMKVISALVEIYPNFLNLIRELDYNLSKEQVLFQGLALNSIETHFNDSVAISIISYDAMQKLNIRREDIDSNTVASNLIMVKNWEIGITMIEREPDQVGISLRSRGKYDVSKVALELGGGGHKPAAGATLRMPLDEAKGKLLDVIKRFI